MKSENNFFEAVSRFIRFWHLDLAQWLALKDRRAYVEQEDKQAVCSRRIETSQQWQRARELGC